ncbi:hypothetical protein J5751_06205 [bacterium]|nr:hypothetical protein [bacterium]
MIVGSSVSSNSSFAHDSATAQESARAQESTTVHVPDLSHNFLSASQV